MTDKLTIKEAVHQIMVAGASEVSEFKDDVIALRKECIAVRKENAQLKAHRALLMKRLQLIADTKALVYDEAEYLHLYDSEDEVKYN